MKLSKTWSRYTWRHGMAMYIDELVAQNSGRWGPKKWAAWWEITSSQTYNSWWIECWKTMYLREDRSQFRQTWPPLIITIQEIQVMILKVGLR